MTDAHPLISAVVTGADNASDVDVRRELKSKIARPPMFGVMLLNDDYTPMEFVVQLLQQVFHKSQDEASAIMMTVHMKGSALCGIYGRDVAETKADQVHAMAVAQSFPLQCVVKQM